MFASQKNSLLFFLSFFLFVFSTVAMAESPAATPTTIRVGVGENLVSVELAVVEGKYELVDGLTHKIICSDLTTGRWVAAPAGSNNLRLYFQGEPQGGVISSYLLLRPQNSAGLNVFSLGQKKYRNSLLLENRQGKIQAINYLDVEEYLLGVVGAEMGVGAPLEAYKAQAIVSRTYAYYSKAFPQLNYDLGVSTQWQVFGGYDQELLNSPLVKEAIEQTKGLVIRYDGSLIQAFFHSNSGGYTEACENVWLESLPYLQPVATPEDSVALQSDLAGSWAAETYLWEKTFTRQSLKEQLDKWNRTNPRDVIQVGEIKGITVQRWALDPLKREFLARETASGRVTQLNFVGTRGTKSFYRDQIRSVLGLRSTLFEIICDSSVKIWNAFGQLDEINDVSNLVAITADGYQAKLNGNQKDYYIWGAKGLQAVPKEFSSITFRGKGYGHGLGMSQWGAWGMALRGASCEEIIEHFYNQNKNDGHLSIEPIF